MTTIFQPMQHLHLPSVLAIDCEQPFPWSETMFHDCLRSNYECIVMEEKQEVIGFGIFSTASKECEILNIAIKMAKRRQGYGSLLLKYFLNIAQQKRAEKIFLEVRFSNEMARDFYQKFGFQEIGKRLDYYAANEGREDAIVYVLYVR